MLCRFLFVLGETEFTKSSRAAGAGYLFSKWNQSGSKALCRHVVEDARCILPILTNGFRSEAI